MYRVLHFFTDKQDDNHAYNVGDIFPRAGKVVSEERIIELATDQNAQHWPLIGLVEDPVSEPKKEEPKKAEAPAKVEKADDHLTENDLMGMTKSEIKNLAAKKGYKINGNNKGELVAEFLKAQK